MHERGCLCASCPVYHEKKLEGLYFCNKDLIGDERIFMRRRKKCEDPKNYEKIIQIKIMSKGKNVIGSMGSPKKPPYTFDDINFIPAQIHRIPLNEDEKVNTEVTIGPKAKRSLKVNSSIIISGMSYGAISEKAKKATATTAKNLGIAYNSGEGGVLEYELEVASSQIILQYSTGRFGLNKEIIKKAAAIEIRFDQGAYPGKGSYLPPEKISQDVARIRGIRKDEGAYFPTHHPDIKNVKELEEKIEWLRKISSGAPIGAKIGCGDIEEDIRLLLDSGVDFISIDGFGGGTSTAFTHIRDNVGLPLISALPGAAHIIKGAGEKGEVSLIAGGGLRTSADMAKCLALGADAIYIGTAALIALNCEQHHLCHTGMCPTGITTHDPHLLKQFNLEKATKRLKNFIMVATGEIADFARITGKDDIKLLDDSDIFSFKRGLAELAGIKWLDGSISWEVLCDEGAMFH
ncbi:MAG: Archaeal glutamate synthase [Methanobacteriaceae archaeon 41_258]|nr:MAG: Archaeal glutamate synthase [Methanobacteriaceae archaeon 41_258]